jgi:hypothetical protein
MRSFTAFVKYNQNSQVMEDEMSRECSAHGREVHITFWWESRKERDHYEDLDLRGKIILKWILQK